MDFNMHITYLSVNLDGKHIQSNNNNQEYQTNCPSRKIIRPVLEQ